MKVHAATAHIELPDSRVAFAGDWHGDSGWMRTAVRGLTRLAPDVTTIFHAGDWSMDLHESDQICRAWGIERILVCPGNHDDHVGMAPLFDAHPGQAIRVSESTWLMPRPFRVVVGGRTLLVLSGATSVDRYWRPGEWSPLETITDTHVAAAAAGGPADLMLTHESPSNTPVRAVRDILRTNPMGFPRESLIESAASRVRVRQVWDAVNPRILFHGHMHVPGGGTTDDGRRVIALGCNRQQGNVAILDLQDLSVEVPTLRQLRGDDPPPSEPGRP